MVRRSIIHHNHFEFRVAERENRFERGSDCIALVEGRHHNRDLRKMIPGSFGDIAELTDLPETNPEFNSGEAVKREDEKRQ